MVRVRPHDGDVSARRLAEALSGDDPVVPPTAAVPLLPAADLPPDQRLDLYRAAAHDARLDDAVRLQAVRALTRESPADTAAADVRRVLATAGDGPLVAGAAGLLAWLGGPADLEVLEGVAARLAPTDPRRRVEFAASVLAHRHGLPGPSVPALAPAVPDGDPGPDAVEVVSTPLTGDDGARAVAAAAVAAPGIADGRPGAVSVDLGGRAVVVVVRDGLDGGVRLAEAPDLPAVVLTTDPEHGDVVLAFVVLTSPRDAGIALDVHRPDGARVLTGRGSVGQGGLAARLTGVRAPGSIPAVLDVRLGPSGLSVAGVVGRRRRAKRVPRRLPD